MTHCINCGKNFSEGKFIGTSHRNHCPHCLYSMHMDAVKPGDRKSNCHSSMKPIALTFKNVGLDKYGRKKQGEIMIVHRCDKCGKISLNRIAGDDDPQEILKILEQTNTSLYDLPKNIAVLTKKDKDEVKKQLLGE